MPVAELIQSDRFGRQVKAAKTQKKLSWPANSLFFYPSLPIRTTSLSRIRGSPMGPEIRNSVSAGLLAREKGARVCRCLGRGSGSEARRGDALGECD
jgi:hypothetical protein